MSWRKAARPARRPENTVSNHSKTGAEWRYKTIGRIFVIKNSPYSLISHCVSCLWLVQCREFDAARVERLVVAHQHGVPDHHTHAARPSVIGAGKIHRLLVDHLAGTAIGDFNEHVVVSHRGAAYDSDHGLVG